MSELGGWRIPALLSLHFSVTSCAVDRGTEAELYADEPGSGQRVHCCGWPVQSGVCRPNPSSLSLPDTLADLGGGVILAAYVCLPLAAGSHPLNIRKRNGITLAVPAVLLAVSAFVRKPFRPGAVHDEESEAGG